VEGFKAQPVPHTDKGNDAEGDTFLLYLKAEQETYRGVPLADVVPGMKMLGNRGCLVVSSEDAQKLSLKRHSTVNITWNGFCVQVPVKASSMVNPGVIHLKAASDMPFTVSPCTVQLRRNDE